MKMKELLKSLLVAVVVLTALTISFFILDNSCDAINIERSEENRFKTICRYNDSEVMVDKETKIIYIKYFMSGVGITPLLDSEGNIQVYTNEIEQN